METAVERWQAIIDARAKQMDAAYAELGRTSADLWSRRARAYYRATKLSIDNSPFLLRLRREITPDVTVLDVGAGTGRYALALAPTSKQVIVVEPNAAMLDFLCIDAQNQGITNIMSYQTRWQDAPDDLEADIVICSHVLYPIRDIVPFLRKLQMSARHACYLYLYATHLEVLTSHLWKHFHGAERCYPPGYIHALDVLFEMGIYANVEIVKFPQSMRYPSLDVAMEELTEQLLLADDERERHKLHNLLKDWLIEDHDAVMTPTKEIACAIVSWVV
jgi:2-polyprenyl-3-methyl-5-hydroxy-6-metoxy-1,4-benzoquinol methylase